MVSLPATVADIGYDQDNKRLYIVTSGNRLFQFENGKLSEITSRIPFDQYSNRVIQSVAVDPNNPRTVYVAGATNVYKSDASVKRSVDGGLKWEIITPNTRTNNGKELGDGANEVFAIRVNPTTSDLWAAGSCYGIWKEIPEDKTTFRITSPKTDTTAVAPAHFLLKTEVLNNTSPIKKVFFYEKETLLASDSISPFDYNWTNVAVGNYEIQAVAADSAGMKYFSQKIKIDVTVSELPTVTITTPVNNAEFAFGAPIEIIIEALDSDGEITKVEFFDGTTTLGEDASPPFSITMQNPAAGSHTFTARATDNTNQTVTSEPVLVKVKPAGGEIVYFEDFNDGLAQDWSPTAGNWAVENNQYRNSTSNGIENCIYTGSTFADYTFSAKIKPDWDNNAGLIFNYTDGNNFYFVELDANPKTAALKAVKNGSESTLATANYTGGGAGNYVTVEIKNDGKTTTVKINGATVFNAVSTPNISFGKIGLYTWWQPVWFDDVDVKAKGADFSTPVIDFENKQATLKIFPNPVTGESFTIQSISISGKKSMLKIFDITGNLVYSDFMEGENITLNSNLFSNTGIYFVQIICNNQINTEKIVFRKTN